ncbi:replication restart helicase PriA [Thermoleophilum album]|uniref:replication restart helicase PriA n=1 Tax=Thermoleophilum album TaxID=29539 RepID=UPI000B81651A|nr:primosomal protein N' [Thermoleophilum album]
MRASRRTPVDREAGTVGERANNRERPAPVTAPAEAVIARVYPLLSTRAVDRPFDYLVDTFVGGDAGELGRGSLLVVPFGRERAIGVVVELLRESELPRSRLRRPLALLAESLPSSLVELCLWLAERYCTTPARAFALALPPGLTARARRQGTARRALLELTEAGRQALGAANQRLGARQRELLAALADGPLATEALAEAGLAATRESLRRLERRGLVRRRPVGTVALRGRGIAVGRLLRDAVPTAAQRKALEVIEARLSEPQPAPLLLHGVTGSGKTEVYLRAAESCLEQGRSVIVLVPEIALAPQTVARFEARFGDAVAVLHSGLEQAVRRGEWQRLRSGAARVCVGARSALFAPCEQLGLVIVDEEHDDAYKQQQDPRYDARRVAEELARRAGALLLAGSATPRVESFARWQRVALQERADGSRLPPVEVVRSEAHGRLAQAAIDALEEVRTRRAKAIVLLNRRGYAPYAACRSCGRALGCPNCDVALVWHRAVRLLRCHHCGYAERPTGRCPSCGSVSLVLGGAGTEQLEQALAALVDPLPVFRLDADTSAATGPARVLAAFERAEAGVLLGTQMVAKGHDFAGVELGLVVAADAALALPDHRAQERVFQLVTQLAGRVGRGSQRGRVIVQASDPQARALRYAARHDADGFVSEELEWRRALGYPPFVELIEIELGSATAGAELAAAERVRSELAQAGVAALGPAPLFRRAGKFRARLVVKAEPPAEHKLQAIREVVAELARARALGEATLVVDVDPC